MESAQGQAAWDSARMRCLGFSETCSGEGGVGRRTGSLRMCTFEAEARPI